MFKVQEKAACGLLLACSTIFWICYILLLISKYSWSLHNILQAVYRYWERNDVKGAISAMQKMADHTVRAWCSIIYFSIFKYITVENKVMFLNSNSRGRCHLFFVCCKLQVLADVMSIVAEKIEIVTLDICSCLLPLLTGLLESDMDR